MTNWDHPMRGAPAEGERIPLMFPQEQEQEHANNNNNNNGDNNKKTLLDSESNGLSSYHATTSSTYASTRTTTTNNSNRSNGSTEQQQRQTKTTSSSWQYFQRLTKSIEWDAVYFGIRMSVIITVASFFILLRKPGAELFPLSMWIVVTVLFVCWFPNSLDAASVVEKSIQRLYGTFLGATSGLSCGFLSLVILYHNTDEHILFTFEELEQQQDQGQQQYDDDPTNVRTQSAFIIICIATYTFLICWGSIQFKVKGDSGPKIITKFNYACILSLLTFYISILPFYSDTRPKWHKARWRVTNVILGCFLGAGLSITVFPRSTKSIIQKKLQHQLKLAGEASQAVLHHAAEQFSESAYVLPSNSIHHNKHHHQQQQQQSNIKSIRERLTLSKRLWRGGGGGNKNNKAALADEDDDIALTKYEAAIGGWKTIKTQLNNLRYDPFGWGAPDIRLTEFRTEVNNIVARIQRIQTTVVLMDGIIKNDPKHNFSVTHINRLARIGTLIRTMLDVSSSTTSSTSTTTSSSAAEEAYTELKTELASIRRDIIELASVVANSPKECAKQYQNKLDMGLIGRSTLDLTQMMMATAMATSATTNPTSASTDNESNNLLHLAGVQEEEQENFNNNNNENNDPSNSSWNNDPLFEEVGNHNLEDTTTSSGGGCGGIVMMNNNDFGGRGAPKHIRGSRVCALLFLQLVEHLALRSLRTYQAWKQSCDIW